MFPNQEPQHPDGTIQQTIDHEFVAYVRGQLSQTMGEIAMRNNRIQENDAYIYGDLLERMLDIPIGHDKTSVNWLRRTCEIHRAQFMGRGFEVASAYYSEDTNDVDSLSPFAQQEQQQKVMENEKRKTFAEQRKNLIDSIIRDNGGMALFADGAENASAIGDWIVKAWYDEDGKKYKIVPVETVEHCYALWKKNDFREWDLFAYVFQISKDEAKERYNVGPDVQTSPLGMPLSILSTANTIEYISTQPMVTIMEITGKAQGWGTDGAGRLKKVPVGEENEINAIIVGAETYRVIDDPKKIPKFYVFHNKKQRRRPWGMPDISKHAVNINLTYIETLSDWRTLAAKSNFPKFKYVGFPFGSQMPKMKPRTVEGLPLVEGQDIIPLNMPNSSVIGEKDFLVQLEELKNEFVREVGVGRVLFDAPDLPMNSAQALKQALKTIGDITSTKQQLWTPVLKKMFMDALQTISYYDDNVKELLEDDSDWYLKIKWPSMLHKDDPIWHAMLLNRFHAGTISVQSYLENIGDNAKEEIDRIRQEYNDPLLASIIGGIRNVLAEFKLMPPGTVPPKLTVNARATLTPEQMANLASQHGFNNGPVFGPTMGPQGELGIRSFDNFVDQNFITGKPYNTGQPIVRDQSGQPVNMAAPGANGEGSAQPTNMPMQPGGSQPMAPEQIATPAQNTPGTQPVSQPGSGAPATSGQGKLNQRNQRKGK